MISYDTLAYAVRRNELIQMLDKSEFPVVYKETAISQQEMNSCPVKFDIDELQITIKPAFSGKYDWELTPVSAILIDIFVPVIWFFDDDFLRDSGIGYVHYQEDGMSVRRVVTFVGGITLNNMLFQFRLMIMNVLNLLRVV